MDWLISIIDNGRKPCGQQLNHSWKVPNHWVISIPDYPIRIAPVRALTGLAGENHWLAHEALLLQATNMKELLSQGISLPSFTTTEKESHPWER